MAGTELPPPPRARRHVAPISVSRVLGRTIPLWFRTLPQLLAAVSIVHVPLATLQWLLRDAGGSAKTVTSAIGYLEMFTGSELTESFVVLLVFQRLRGTRVELGRSIASGARRFATILGIGVILNLPSFVETFLSGGERPNFPLMAAFLATALVILLLFCVAAPVVVVERRGVFESLRRSRELTRGFRGTIFGTYFIAGVLLSVGGLVIALAQMILPSPKSDLARFLLDTSGAVLVASYFVVLPIVLYHELREAKEGIGLDEIAAVFE